MFFRTSTKFVLVLGGSFLYGMASFSWAEGREVLDCLLKPSMEIELASPVAGVIRDLSVVRGDMVKEGQLVAALRDEVESALYKLNIFQAEFGRRTIARNDELFKQNLLSEQERDRIEMDNGLYALQASQVEAQLKQKRIFSPISGVVIDRMRDPGEGVGDGPILKIAKLDPLHAELVVSLAKLGSVEKGDELTIEVAQPFGGVYAAKVIVVDPVVDAASGTFGILLNLPNPNNIIPAGLKCTVSF